MRKARAVFTLAPANLQSRAGLYSGARAIAVRKAVSSECVCQHKASCWADIRYRNSRSVASQVDSRSLALQCVSVSFVQLYTCIAQHFDYKNLVFTNPENTIKIC